MSEENRPLPQVSIKSYVSSGKSLSLHYLKGELKAIHPYDKIEWDGLKDQIEYLEEDLDKTKFRLVE